MTKEDLIQDLREYFDRLDSTYWEMEKHSSLVPICDKLAPVLDELEKVVKEALGDL